MGVLVKASKKGSHLLRCGNFGEMDAARLWIADGDKVVTRWTGRGTHDGDLMGVAPTGKQVTVSGLTLSRLANGKVVEEYTNWDTFGMMKQLGVVPELAHA